MVPEWRAWGVRILVQDGPPLNDPGSEVLAGLAQSHESVVLATWLSAEGGDAVSR